jgi:superfamily II DNA or RNA helicase
MEGATRKIRHIDQPPACMCQEMKLRAYQEKALEALHPHRTALVAMCCGSGKTFTLTSEILQTRLGMTVLVFPSLVLMRQYHRDYVDALDGFGDFSVLQVCSDSGDHFTTSSADIQAFLATDPGRPKLLTVTYHSFTAVANAIVATGTPVGHVVFDEAHHLGGKHSYAATLGNVAFQRLVQRTSFWTATPRNPPRLTMYDHSDPGRSQCGPTVFTYSLQEAIEDGVCKPVQATVLLCRDPLDNSIDRERVVVDMVVRAALEREGTGYSYCNMLTYHHRVNPPDEKKSAGEATDFTEYVRTFATPVIRDRLRVRMQELQSTEYPESKLDAASLELEAMHSDMPGADREYMLAEFDRKVPGRVRILASCDTLHEGMNSRWANQAVAFGPSGSVMKETQRMGHLARKPEAGVMSAANILLPVCIDMSRFDPGWSPQDKDAYIRQEIQQVGNFRVLLHAATALEHQDEPDLGERLLAYPHVRNSTLAVRRNLERQGCVVGEPRARLATAIQDALAGIGSGAGKGMVDNDEDDEDDEDEDDEDEDDVEMKAAHEHPASDATAPDDPGNGDAVEETEDRILRRTATDTGRSVELHTQSATIPVRLFAVGGQDPADYVPGATPVCLLRVNDGTAIAYHAVGTAAGNIGDDGASTVHQRIEPMQPAPTSAPKVPFHVRTHPDLEVLLGVTSSFDPTRTVVQAVVDLQVPSGIAREVVWAQKLQEVERYIDTHGRRPSPGTNDATSRQLGSWISNQRQNTKLPRKYAMKNDEVFARWEAHLQRYHQHYESGDVAWRRILEEIERYIDTHGRRPPNSSKDTATQRLAGWIGTQLQSAKPPRKHVMQDVEVFAQWEAHLQEYRQHYEPPVVAWRRILAEVERYIDLHGRRPSKGSKDTATQRLATWVSHQLRNAKPPHRGAMADDDVSTGWEAHLQRYSQYYEGPGVAWRRTLEEVERYIDIHGRRPPNGSHDRATKKLATWINKQVHAARPPRKGVMKDDQICARWEVHLQRYSQHSNSDRHTTASEDSTSSSQGAAARPPPSAVSGRDNRISRMHAEYAHWLATHDNVHPRPDAGGRERVLYIWRDTLCIQELSPPTVQCMEVLPNGSSVASPPVPGPPPPASDIHASVQRSSTPPSLVQSVPPVPHTRPPMEVVSGPTATDPHPPPPPPPPVRRKRSGSSPGPLPAVPVQSSKRQKLLVTAKRTAYLLQSDDLTPSESKELDALLDPDDGPSTGSGDTYNDQGQCSPEHAPWKRRMNGIFLTLRPQYGDHREQESGQSSTPLPRYQRLSRL